MGKVACCTDHFSVNVISYVSRRKWYQISSTHCHASPSNDTLYTTCNYVTRLSQVRAWIHVPYMWKFSLDKNFAKPWQKFLHIQYSVDLSSTVKSVNSGHCVRQPPPYCSHLVHAPSGITPYTTQLFKAAPPLYIYYSHWFSAHGDHYRQVTGYTVLPIPNLRGSHPIAYSGKPNPNLLVYM